MKSVNERTGILKQPDKPFFQDNQVDLFTAQLRQSQEHSSKNPLLIQQ
jgi:hypothetical protein